MVLISGLKSTYNIGETSCAETFLTENITIGNTI